MRLDDERPTLGIIARCVSALQLLDLIFGSSKSIRSISYQKYTVGLRAMSDLICLLSTRLVSEMKLIDAPKEGNDSRQFSGVKKLNF